MPYNCTLCDEQEGASFLITPLTGGDTMAVGQQCAPVALCGLFASYLGVDADKLWSAAERLVKAAQRDAARQTGDGQAAAAAGRESDQAADGQAPGGDSQPAPSPASPPDTANPSGQAQAVGVTS